jgi:hypothetical protein
MEATLAERFFVGTCYVYRGEYPRRDKPTRQEQSGTKPGGNAGQGIARFRYRKMGEPLRQPEGVLP